METWDAITARRNVRQYTDESIEQANLDRILEAGRRSPSASNRYRVIDQYDLGQATMAMMLAATDLGIGTGHAAVDDQNAARRILGLPENHYAAYMLALGNPADGPLRPIENLDRRPFDDVVHRERW